MSDERKNKVKITISLDCFLVETIKEELKALRFRDLENNTAPSSFSSLVNSLLVDALQVEAAV